MFWHRTRTDRYEHQWNTEGGHDHLWVMPNVKDNGKPFVWIEGGSSVSPKHDHHYHDYLLDVTGKNFEDAYIKVRKESPQALLTRW